jgi:hypothetical protein
LPQIVKYQKPDFYTFLNKAYFGITDTAVFLQSQDTAYGPVWGKYYDADSALGPHWEFMPKGTPIDKWTVCLDTAQAPHPLYWLGETSRKWFIFSNQNLKDSKRCATMNEVRDIASLLDTVPPTLGAHKKDSLETRFPVLDSLSGPGFSCLSVHATDSAKTWVPFDFDSEPQEILVENADIPSDGKLIFKLCDEARNKREILLEGL